MASKALSKKVNRREQILEAALWIIGEEGLRGLTYRSVAERANIPLGSTTYYYSSIKALYLDAYDFFLKESYIDVDVVYKEANKIFMGYLKKAHTNKDSFDKVVGDFASLITDYIRVLAESELDKRKVEAAFEHSAIIDNEIKRLVWKRRSHFIEWCAELFENFGVNHPLEKAELFMGTMNQLERRALMDTNKRFNKKRTYAVLHHFFSITLAEIKNWDA